MVPPQYLPALPPGNPKLVDKQLQHSTRDQKLSRTKFVAAHRQAQGLRLDGVSPYERRSLSETFNFQRFNVEHRTGATKF